MTKQVSQPLTFVDLIYLCRIALADFPSCVLGEPPELTPESLELGEPQVYCWRNLYACINLLRILNKLTKWKHSRIMVIFSYFL